MKLLIIPLTILLLISLVGCNVPAEQTQLPSSWPAQQVQTAPVTNVSSPPPPKVPDFIVYTVDSGTSKNYVITYNKTMDVVDCGTAAFGAVTRDTIDGLSPIFALNNLIITNTTPEKIGGCIEVLRFFNTDFKKVIVLQPSNTSSPEFRALSAFVPSNKWVYVDKMDIDYRNMEVYRNNDSFEFI